MTNLEQKIKDYADQYYQGNEQISDEEYDTLIEELRRENSASKLLPENQGITGSDLKGVSKKYKLPVTMGTLSKCNTDDQLKDWWNKHSHNDIVCELKIDGNGVLLEFENGVLIKAYSRGDGIYGEDRTDKVFNILKRDKNPTKGNVAKGFYGWIRGEIYMKRSTFEDYFKNSKYKNPRNLTAGILGRDDCKDCDLLNLIVYDVFTSPKNEIGNSIVETEQAKLQFLTSYKYETPEFKINPTFEELKKWKDSIDTSKTEIPCDGIVIKQNKVNRDDLMRLTPENNVAYKPNLQTAMSIIKDIKWQLKGRYLSPLAIIEPVELEGTTVTKASLANVNKMKEKGVYTGAKVIVSKHGMIIPSIDLVLDPKQNAFKIPEVCPRCNSELILNESGFPECVNEKCIAKLEHQFSKFFDILNIKIAGPSFIKNAAETCSCFKDSFKMLIECAECNDCLTFKGWANGKNGEKVLKQVREYVGQDSIKTITPAQFCAMMDWPSLSVKQFEKIPNFSLSSALNGVDYSELVKIQGIGDEVAQEMIKFWTNKKDDLKKLSTFFKISDKVIEESSNLPTICFTGACPGYSRNQLTEMCKGKYTVVDSVTKDLNTLACSDPNSGSSKLQKATKNGTKVISYDELLTQIFSTSND